MIKKKGRKIISISLIFFLLVLSSFMLMFFLYPREKPELSPFTEGLVAYYPLEGNGIDYGGDNDGNTVGTLIIDGIGGTKAFYFNGVSSRVDASKTNFKLQNEITVSAWVKPEAAPDGRGRMIVNYHAYDSNFAREKGWILGNSWGSDNFIQFRMTDSSGRASSARTSDSLAFFNRYKDEWVHVVGAYKAGQFVKLYINGDKIAENTNNIISTIDYPADSLNLPMRIGARSDGASTANWKGGIDEVRIYNRVLTDEEITLLYNADVDKVAQKDMVAYYPFSNENYTFDHSGNRNDASQASATLINDSKIGKALKFNAGNNNKFIIDAGKINLDGKNESFFAWVKFDNQSNEINPILYQDNGWSRRIFYNQKLDTLNLILSSSPQGNYYRLNSSITSNEWHHIGYTISQYNNQYSRYLIIFYVDGYTKDTEWTTPAETVDGIVINEVDRRTLMNMENQRYRAMNIPRAEWGGKSPYQVQNEVTKKIEVLLTERANKHLKLSVNPLDLPTEVDDRIKSRIMAI